MNFHERLSSLAFTLFSTLLGFGTVWGMFVFGIVSLPWAGALSSLVASIGILASLIMFFSLRDYQRFYEEDEHEQ